MTDTASTERVSDELLAEMLADAQSEANRKPRDATVYDFEPEHIVAALTELQSLRSAASVGVKAAARKLMGQLVGDGDPSILLVPDNVDANDFANAYADLEAALAVPETEGDGEPVALPDRCPTCDLIWKHHPPAIIKGSESVRCVECKSIFTSPQPAAVSVADGWVMCEVARLRPEYQTNSMLDVGRRQLLDHFEKLAAAPQPPQPVKVNEAMVERAARALHANSKGKHNHFNPFEDLSAQRILWLREDARAALAAALSHEGEAK